MSPSDTSIIYCLDGTTILAGAIKRLCFFDSHILRIHSTNLINYFILL